jgi:signal transduction histidine kinase
VTHTELHKVHERLQATFQEYMQIKDNLLATVSHEMRSPLHGIIASVDLLNKEKEECQGDSGAGTFNKRQIERAGLLQNVTHCASVLHLVINNVLLSGAKSRDLNTLVVARTKLGEVVTKVESVAKALALGKRMQLNIFCDEEQKERTVVLSDELALVQVSASPELRGPPTLTSSP